MTLRPLHDRVLIRRVELAVRTPSGIFIPDAAQEKPVEGEVVAVEPGVRSKTGTLQPMEVKPADRVLFGQRSGAIIKFDGEELMIMNEAGIMGVLDHAATSKQAA